MRWKKDNLQIFTFLKKVLRQLFICIFLAHLNPQLSSVDLNITKYNKMFTLYRNLFNRVYGINNLNYKRTYEEPVVAESRYNLYPNLLFPGIPQIQPYFLQLYCRSNPTLSRNTINLTLLSPGILQLQPYSLQVY